MLVARRPCGSGVVSAWRTLAQSASGAAAELQMRYMHAQALAVEDKHEQTEPAARMLCHEGCLATPASGMLAPAGAPRATQSAMTRVEQRLLKLGFDDHVCQPIHWNPMPALLSRHSDLRAPVGPQEPGGSARDARSPATDATPMALDPAALARLTELDPKGENQLLARVLRAFQTSVARLRPQAEAARRGGDLADLRLVAHTLKSSSASIGAIRLSQVCAQIETTICTAGGDGLDAQLDAFDVALDDALRAIERLLKDLG
jgi:HPt (histidine-containing phosphotransfer) domain-containing protein